MPPSGWLPWAGVAFVVACAGTWLARRYALRRRLIDQPGERRSHQVATPRGGGVAIVPAVLPLLAWLAWRTPAERPLFVAIAAGLLLVAGIGWLDDHRPLSPWLRLGVHALASACLACGIAPDAGLAGALLAFAAAMALTNVWNFMDGIDGLAASQALLVASACALWAGGGAVALLAVALAAACAGFLPFNLPPARIFLGDVGSGALGFLVAALLAMLAPRDWATASLLLLPISAFVLDAGFTLASRIRAGERWWLPHTSHAYQRWTRRLGRHGPVTAAYAAWTLGASLLMLAGKEAGAAFTMPVLAGCGLAGAAAWTRLRALQPSGDRE
ncbi:MAG TPA: glycosyltransferase family 4 protein [Xanthomonadaceae bacterium]|nr:glycosyltransferase family 4 protein [Xanthomonadaceae bacterium]